MKNRTLVFPIVFAVMMLLLISCSTTQTIQQNAQEPEHHRSDAGARDLNTDGSQTVGGRGVASQAQGRACVELQAPAGNMMEYCAVCADSEGKRCRYMSRLIMGTDHFNQSSWQNDEQKVNELRSRAVLYEALRMGINVFDTAPIYVGNAENRVGTWIAEFKEYVKTGRASGDLQEWFDKAGPVLDGDAANDRLAKMGENKSASAVVSWLRDKQEDIKEYYFEPRKGMKLSDGRTAPTALMTHVITKGGFPFDLYHLHCFPADKNGKLDQKAYSNRINRINQSKNEPDLKVVPVCLKGQDGVYKWDVANEGEKFLSPGTYASRLYGSVTQIQERLEEEFGNSSANLRNDIAVYLMHRDDGDYYGFKPLRLETRGELTPVETIMKGIQAAIERIQAARIPTDSEPEGTLPLMIGWSNWSTTRINKSLEVHREKGLFRPVMNSAYFSLFEMKDRLPIHAGGIQVTHKEMMDPEFQKGIFQSSYSPLGGFSILDQSGETPTKVWNKAMTYAKQKAETGDAYWQNVYFTIFCNDKKPSVEDMNHRTQHYAQKPQQDTNTKSNSRSEPEPKPKLEKPKELGECQTPNVANEQRYRRATAFAAELTAADTEKRQYSVDQVLNAYALAHVRADFLTVGPITIDQVRRTARALQLSEQLTRAKLDELYGSESQNGN